MRENICELTSKDYFMCSTPTKPSRDSLTNQKDKKRSLKGINLKLKLRH